MNNKSDNDLVYDFFKKRKGDSNWTEMVYDNLSNKRSTCIGYSFVKNIAVGKAFPYSISGSDTELYAKRIVIIRKKEVEERLRMQMDERCLFDLSRIFLARKK